MQSANARPSIPVFQSNKSFAIALTLVILAVIGLSVYSAYRAAQSPALPPAKTIVSQQALGEKYGLGVNLVAVTAAGGMVDLRLRILDGEKAKALLENQANFPVLRARDNVVLRASQDITSQTIQFENGGVIFVLYPNAQNAVKPGDSVSIVFGDVQVEAIQVK